jgi:hypothetical protein
VVGDLLALRARPCVDVDVLHLRSAVRQRARNEDMIELFRVLVVRVRITLHLDPTSQLPAADPSNKPPATNRIHARDLIDVMQYILEGREHRTSVDELVHITAHYHTRVRIEGQQLSDECLHDRTGPSSGKARKERTTARTAVTFTCASLVSTAPLTGGRASPCVDELPRFDEKWTLTVKNRSPVGVCQCAASGLRASIHAGAEGSIRPGLNLRVASDSRSRPGRIWGSHEIDALQRKVTI